MQPTERTLQWLRNSGRTAEMVEYWNPWSKTRHDLFNFIDIIAIRKGGPGCLGIQATTAANVSTRVTKILGLRAAREWVEAGNKIWVIGWKKIFYSGRWEPVMKVLTIDDFPKETAPQKGVGLEGGNPARDGPEPGAGQRKRRTNGSSKGKTKARSSRRDGTAQHQGD